MGWPMDSWICKPELRAVQNQVELALGALVGGVQRHGLFGDARRVLQQAQLVHQLVALQLILAAEGVRIGALLDLAVLVAERGEAGAREIARLVDDAAERGDEHLAAAFEMHRGLGQGDARIAPQFRVDGQQHGADCWSTGTENGSMRDGRDPGRPRTCLPARARRRACAPRCRSARSRAPGRRRLRCRRRQIVGGGEAPAAVRQHADADARAIRRWRRAPALPFLVAISRSRISTARTSA